MDTTSGYWTRSAVLFAVLCTAAGQYERAPVFKGSVDGGCRGTVLTFGGPKPAQSLTLMYSISHDAPLGIDVSEVDAATQTMEHLTHHPVFDSSSGSQIVDLARDTQWSDLLCLSDTGSLLAVELTEDKTRVNVPVPVKLGTSGPCRHVAQGVVEGRSIVFACCDTMLYIFARDTQTTFVPHGTVPYSCRHLEILGDKLYLLSTSDTTEPASAVLTAAGINNQLLAVTAFSKPRTDSLLKCPTGYAYQAMSQTTASQGEHVLVLGRCRNTSVPERAMIQYDPVTGIFATGVRTRVPNLEWLAVTAYNATVVDFLSDPYPTGRHFFTSPQFKYGGQPRFLVGITGSSYAETGMEVGHRGTAQPGLSVHGNFLVVCTDVTRELYELMGYQPVRCDQFTCEGDFVDKEPVQDAQRSIYCGDAVSSCTSTVCCNATCLGHTCGVSYHSRIDRASISCGGDASQCTDGKCCYKLCNTYTCGPTFQLKPTPAAIVCPGTPSTCDDATCCVADKLCNTHTCTSGLQLKASASSITCTGTPSACTDATCCDKLCGTHRCRSTFQLKPTPGAIICPGTPSTCDDATCCVAHELCNTHTCTSGSQLKASASFITCTGNPSACTDATCCEKLCTTYTCSAGSQPKASVSFITCTGTPATCTDATCCETLCSTHTCSATFLDKPSKATLPCRSTPPVCDDATCCDTEFVCSDHTCGTGFVGNALKGNTSCGARPCPDETCCLASVPVSTFVPAEEQTTAKLLGVTTSGTIVVVSAVGGVAGVSGLGKGGARVARNMVYLSMMDCPRSGVEEVGFVLSPTRLSFGGDDLREVRGAVVGNLALLALVVALVVGVAALRGGCFLVSLAGMPLALPVLLLELLWMPVVQGGFAFVMYSESEAAGGAAVLTCALLFLVGTGLLTRKAKAQCTFVHNKREKGLVWFVTAAGSWESTDGPRPSVDVLASVFDGFHPAHCLYFVVQLVSMTGLAALAAWNPKTIVFCGVRAGMLTILPIVWAAVLLKDLPYLRPIENAVEILITLCEFFFGFLATLAVGQQNQSLYDAAAVLGVVMTYIMMVKTAIDLCTLVYQLREEYTNHGTVCGPPVRMCCGAGCAKCASLGSSKVCFSEPLLASCTGQESLGTNESETNLVQLQAAACQTPSPPDNSPSAQYYAGEDDGYIYL